MPWGNIEKAALKVKKSKRGRIFLIFLEVFLLRLNKSVPFLVLRQIAQLWRTGLPRGSSSVFESCVDTYALTGITQIAGQYLVKELK